MIATQHTTVFRDGEAIFEESTILPHKNPSQELHLLNLYPQICYQSVDFFGGAITDAVAATLEKMPTGQADAVLNAYFGKDGVRYRAIRTHIDSCDFSTEPYAAIVDPNDFEFSTFSLDRIGGRTVKWILRAYEIAGESLPVILTPWSPPAFMKTNSSRTGGGRLKKEHYGNWAKYICRYIAELKKLGIDVRAITVQNEPNATQTWDSCLYSAEEERIFLSDYLYPTMMEYGFSDIDIYIWDHNKERLFDRVSDIVTDDNAKMITGAAFHWYSGDHFDALRLVREQYPNLRLMFSEGCIEYSRFEKNQLTNAQIYGHDMIGNFSAGMNSFVDWNICLDENGGPNYALNYCEAPIICDTRSGLVSYHLSFYYISHFSRYILPGAKRIASTTYSEIIEHVAFINPNGDIVVVVLNRTAKTLPLVIRHMEQLYSTNIQGNSITTLTIEKEDYHEK